jgi:hypothetical protein
VILHGVRTYADLIVDLSVTIHELLLDGVNLIKRE